MILRLLKVGAILEGISVIALFLFAMPLKYIWDNPSLIKSTGMAHGVLFVFYSFFVVLATKKYKWNISKLGLLLLLGFIPFGTFYAEKKLI